MEIGDLNKYSNLLIQFLAPVVKATESPENAKALLNELGYEPPSDVTAFNDLNNLLEDIFQGIESIDQLIESNSNDDSRQTTVLLELFIKSGKAVKHLSTFSTQIQQNFAGSDFLTQTDISSALPVKLTDLLFISYTEKKLPQLYSFLLFIGVIEEEFIEELLPHITSHTKRTLHWDKISQLFTDPIQVLKDTFVDGEEIRFNKLIYLLEEIGVSLGVFAEVNLPTIDKISAFNQPGILNTTTFDDIRFLRFPLVSDPFGQLALEIYPVINVVNEKTEGIGVAITFGSQLEIPIDDKIQLKINFSASLHESLGVKIDKDGNLSFSNNIFSNPHALEEAIQINFKASFEPVENPLPGKFIELAAPGGSKFEIGSSTLTLGIDKKGREATFYIEAELKDGLLVIGLGSADSFIGSVVSNNTISSNFSLGIGFSNKAGLYFKGGSLEVAIPTHIQLGPIEILQIALGIKIKDQDLNSIISTSFNAKLGPLSIVVENIGIKADTKTSSDRNGNFGPLDISFGFKPPDGLGISINTGAVTGGGFLKFDPENGEYSGTLDLTIVDLVSVKALGFITTKMPDGSKGFSLLIIITAEFTPPYQLGDGFTLNAVGGLLGLNRTVLVDTLREGVRTGAVNSIMFPQNVIANAPRIISDLKKVFPPYEGRFLIGPMAKLGWGSPTLVTLSLGLIIEIPGNIAILGVLRIVLPDEQKPLVNINVNFVGIIDFNKKLFSFDASLFDSRILQMTLEGDMAVRLKWGDDPDFILTVGGFHPQYNPPPLALPTLKRITINVLNRDNARLRFESYHAITSNTVQFGSKAELYFGFSAFSVEGNMGFDALFQFSPFIFIIDVSGHVSFKAFGVGVFSIHLKFSLQGPTPWRAKGRGGISFLFFSVSANFDKTWGETIDTSLPAVEAFPRLLEELNKQEQWQASLNFDKKLFVSLRKLDETETALLMHPAGALIVQQKLMPLDLDIDKLGNQTISDIKNVAISKAVSGDTELDVAPVAGPFALAQYKNMSDADKLSRPSFEKLQAGVSITMHDQAIAMDMMTRRVVEYEEIIIDKESQKPKDKGQLGVLFVHFLKGNAATKSVLSKSRKDKLQPFAAKIAVNEENYAVAFTENNMAYSTGSSFSSEAMAADHMQKLITIDPMLKDRLHVIGGHEINYN